MTTETRLSITKAAPSAEQAGHPYADRFVRTSLNYRMRALGIPAKMCSRCLRIQSLSSFSKYTQASDGLYANCRTCKSEIHALKQATDPEYRRKAAERTRNYYAEHTEERKAYSVRHRSEVRSRNVARNANRVPDPDALKRCAGRCNELLPETSFRLDRGRPDGLRSRCKACTGDAARPLCWDTHGDPTGQTCYLCMTPIAGPREAQADHLLPVSRGGSEDPANLRWTHSPCNASRNDRLLTAEEWARIDHLNQNGDLR
ncbi:HNH endonuclease [Streptomyces zaomyceticus]|uniref:HNH endonuclease n=1 Tax=Streptomyces zaomyceticus TaxID=68286 RepID=UPI0037ABD65F